MESLGCINHSFLLFLEDFCSQWMWEQESQGKHEVVFPLLLELKVMPTLCLGEYLTLEQSP